MRENLFPLFLKLDEVPVLLVGAGRVATRKAQTLVACGARVQVVAPSATPEIEALAQARRLTLARRPYAADDLSAFGARLLFAATPDAALNRELARAARAAGILVNVADAPELCDFYLPAVLRRGPLQIAVSTGGAAPGLARRLRDELALRYSEAWAERLRVIGRLRRQRLDARKERR